MLHFNFLGNPHVFQVAVKTLTSVPLMTPAVFASATDVYRGGLIAQCERG